jgi:predicted nucleic acid-binding protein
MGKLNLLHIVFDQVLVPTNVMAEVRSKPDHDDEVWNQQWLIPANGKAVGANGGRYQELCRVLDPGESEAIALAVKESLPLLIDERKGRAFAARLGVPVIGLLGLLAAVVRAGFLSAEAAAELVLQARKEGFRVSDPLYRQFMESLQ